MVRTRDNQIRELDSLLGQARDTLLDWSRDALKAKSDYERHIADLAFELAKQADDLRRRIVDIAEDERAPAPKDEPLRSTEVSTVDKKPRDPSMKKRRRSGYPKYLRRGKTLVKVGLSRDKKSEYRHIVPESEYRRIIELVKTTGKAKKEFTADDLLTSYDGASYHPYIVLALLREKKVVALVRRGTYKLSSKDGTTIIDGIWKDIPEE